MAGKPGAVTTNNSFSYSSCNCCPGSSKCRAVSGMKLAVVPADFVKLKKQEL